MVADRIAPPPPLLTRPIRRRTVDVALVANRRLDVMLLISKPQVVDSLIGVDTIKKAVIIITRTTMIMSTLLIRMLLVALIIVHRVAIRDRKLLLLLLLANNLNPRNRHRITVAVAKNLSDRNNPLLLSSNNPHRVRQVAQQQQPQQRQPQ